MRSTKNGYDFISDFCDKYPVPEQLPERVRLFTDKLRSKKQSEALLKCAAHAVSLYEEMQRGEGDASAADEGTSGVTAPESLPTDGLKQVQPTKQAERKTEYTVAKPADSAAPTPPPRRFAASRSNFSVEGYTVTSDSPEIGCSAYGNGRRDQITPLLKEDPAAMPSGRVNFNVF